MEAIEIPFWLPLFTNFIYILNYLILITKAVKTKLANKGQYVVAYPLSMETLKKRFTNSVNVMFIDIQFNTIILLLLFL